MPLKVGPWGRQGVELGSSPACKWLESSSLPPLDCGPPENVSSFLRPWECPVPAGMGTWLGELPILFIPVLVSPDHGAVTLPERLPSRITVQLPALALCTRLPLCPELGWLLSEPNSASVPSIPLTFCCPQGRWI